MRTCSIDECGRRHLARGWCERHYDRWRRTGDPLECAFEQDRGGVIGYVGAHHRVKYRRGRAAEYQCAGCGGLASEWAYDHNDPNELTQVKNNPRGEVIEVAYSLDPNHYQAMCVPCHRAFDANR